MKIEFPPLPLSYTLETTVAFAAEVDGALRSCEISEEALQDHFKATSNQQKDLFTAFEAGRGKIEEVARKHLEIQRGEGRVLIRTTDF